MTDWPSVTPGNFLSASISYEIALLLFVMCLHKKSASVKVEHDTPKNENHKTDLRYFQDTHLGLEMTVSKSSKKKMN